MPTKEQIKIDCEFAYQAIEAANKRLKELRSLCNHEETFEGNYSWRVGSIYPATICSHCGELIKLHIGNDAHFEIVEQKLLPDNPDDRDDIPKELFKGYGK